VLFKVILRFLPLSSQVEVLCLPVFISEDSYGLWKVIEIDSAIFQDLESFGKEKFFKMAMEKF